MYAQKVISIKIQTKLFLFVGTLKVTDEKSRIRVKCHGSGTLDDRNGFDSVGMLR
jgi:hypothetical protein